MWKVEASGGAKRAAISCTRLIPRWPRRCNHCSTHSNVCLRDGACGCQAALSGDVAFTLGTAVPFSEN
jgi:hypothetical protein